MAGPVFLFGDADCFSLAASCPDGTRFRTDLGGSFAADYRTLSDPAFTDRWFFDAPVTDAMNYAMPASPSTARIIFRIAGMGDVALTYDVRVNGVSVGTIPLHTGANNWEELLTYSFSVPVSLLDGSDSFSISTQGADGFIIDYAALEFDPVPEPATWILMAGSVAWMLVMRRRVRRET